MANSNSVKQDENQVYGLHALSGTLGASYGTAETRPLTASDTGQLHVLGFDSLVQSEFDTITAGYPDGTTETYSYTKGTVPVTTLTVTYTDSTKGSISAVVRS